MNRLKGIFAALLALVAAQAGGQNSMPMPTPTPQSSPVQLAESGEIALAGRTMHYLIRRLPVSSFPELPAEVAEALNQRACLIPQTYQAHRPENVVHASLERPGSTDWAVLCSVKGTVSLLVFFSGNPQQPLVLAAAPETERLQAHDPSGVLGFNWGIDPVSPARVHQAQSGMSPRPVTLDHDALADTLIDRRTVYHFYVNSIWTVLAMPD